MTSPAYGRDYLLAPLREPDPDLARDALVDVVRTSLNLDTPGLGDLWITLATISDDFQLPLEAFMNGTPIPTRATGDPITIRFSLVGQALTDQSDPDRNPGDPDLDPPTLPDPITAYGHSFSLRWAFTSGLDRAAMNPIEAEAAMDTVERVFLTGYLAQAQREPVPLFGWQVTLDPAQDNPMYLYQLTDFRLTKVALMMGGGEGPPRFLDHEWAGGLIAWPDEIEPGTLGRRHVQNGPRRPWKRYTPLRTKPVRQTPRIG